MKAIFTSTELNKTNHTPQATLSPGHTHAKHPARLRCFVVSSALLLICTIGLKAANEYIFYNNTNGYIVNNNGNLGVSTTFSKSSIWIASGTLNTNNSRSLQSYSNTNQYFVDNEYPTIDNSAGTNRWRINNNSILTSQWNNNYYLRYANNAFNTDTRSNTTANGTEFTALAISINSSTPSTPTISISAVAGLSGGGIQLTGNVSGTYTPNYNYASIRNYNNNNTQTYYWTSNTEATTTQPSSITNWNDATITWEVTTGGAYASVSSDGLVTITANPTGNIVVRMNVSKGVYTGNTSITLTCTVVAENTATSYSPITVTPSSATLDLEESKTFAVSNTVTETSSTIPAHTKITVDSKDFYYYNSSLNTTPPSSNTSNSTTLNLSSVNWADGGGGGYYTLSTYYSDSNNKTTLTRTSLKSDTNLSYTITATANYGGKSQNLTASATVTIPFTYVDIDNISCSGVTIPFGETRTLEPNTWINGTGAKYVNIVYSVADGTIVSVDANGVVTALNVGNTTVTLQSKKIDGTNGVSCTATITVNPAALPAPTITLDSNTGVATITDNSGISGATIRYTTDNTAPTASTATIIASGGTVTLTRGQTLMAIVTVDGGNYSPSPAATETFIETGSFGGTIYIDDREDHTWTYYSGVDASVDGGNYNTNYLGKLYSPNPRNVMITYQGVNGVSNSNITVKVSVDEDETEFVYLKTLEMGSTNGEYPYQVISNPFSVRPSTGSGNSKVYYGFDGWKIVSGGEYIKNHNNNDVLDLDEEIVFNNLPYPSVNCTSAKIVFQTTWKTANRTYVSTNPSSDQTYSISGDYESNFYVINCDYTRTITTSGPVTIMMVEPDGSGDYRSKTFSGNITPNNDGVTKIEWAKWTTTSGINATGRYFTIGRGIQRPNGGSTLYGSNTNRVVNQIFKIESGIWQNFYALGSSAPTNNMTKQYIVFGNDYDRAKGTNTNLVLTNTFRLMDANITIGNNKEIITVKSGQLTRDLDHSTAQASGNCFYLWNNSANTTGGTGTRELIVEGGEMWHIAGGVDEDNYADDVNLRIRVKGGTIHGSIYGGAARYDTRGYKQFIFTGGTVEGWIAGGSNGYLAAGGSSYEYGTVTGRSYVYVGGTTQVSSGNSTTAINVSVGGNVYGAGCGNTSVANSGRVTEQTNVVIADECYVQRGVYGGGAYGNSPGTANVYITGNAHVGGIYESTYDVYGGVYGGARAKGGGSVNIYMSGGLIEHGLYGGSNATGTISNDVTMKINGGQVGTGTGSGQTANIHGGGYGQSTVVSGNVDITLGAQGQTKPGVTVYGDVYGGSALGSVNGTSDNANNHTYVTLNKGTIIGSLYGGALGQKNGVNGATSNIEANVYSPVQVTVNGGKATNVFGCNNLNGRPRSTVSVTINGTDNVDSGNAVDNVFGGGNQAAYTGTPIVQMKGGIVGNVFGGGNEAGITGGGSVTMTGGNVNQGIYGGCNTSGTVTDAITVNITGGTIGIDETHTANVHGGGYGSDTGTGDDVTVSINGSEINIWGDVYGGSALGNVNGSTSHNTKVTLTDGTIHGCIYGGGLGDNSNPALVNGNVTVTVDGGKVLTTTVESRTTGAVFGCNNVNGTPKGTVDVIINGTAASEGTGDSKVYALQGVYGGGNQAHYDPTNTSETYPRVTINGCETSIKDVYGGGNAAAVPNTNVIINGGDIKRVFAGGNGESNVPANIGYKNKLEPTNANSYGSGKAVASINGGTIVQVFGGSNAHGVVRAGGKVSIENAGTCEMHITDVFGGGNEAAGAAGEIEIKCTGGATEGITNVYGGANKADVSSDITLNITGGRINNVFGGNNERGNVAGKITVNIEVDGTCSNNSINNVYGGGNLASYTPTTAGAYPEVNIKNGTISGNVFGGGLGATAKVYSNPKVTIGDVSEGHSSYVATVTGNVYGGGSAAMVGDDVAATASINNTTVLIQKSNTSVGKVFGGGAQAGVTGTTSVTIANGSISSGVYGGCDESGTVGGKITVSLTNGTIGALGSRADVFGGGLGSATATSGDIEVTLNGTTVYGDIYGGSALGSVNAADANPANTTTLTISSNTLHGTIYGGGKGDHTSLATQQDPDHSNVTATSNGNVVINYNTTNTNLTGLYGGANINGLVVGNIEVNVKGNVGTDANNKINIFGGGLGAPTSTNGSVTVNVGTADGTSAPVVYGDVYGGSALGSVNDAAADLTTINILNGTIHGNIYGGGLGDATVNANGYLDTTQPTVEAIVNGTVHVNIGHETNTNSAPTIDGKVFGCNNLAGTPKGNVYVDVYRTNHTSANSYPDPAPATIADMTDQTAYAILEVYGGGNLAHYTTTLQDASTHVHIHNCDNTIQYVYGGGNAANTPATSVIIDGGRFNYVFGGGNGAGTGNPGANVEGNSNVTLNGGIIDYVFGGSNTLGVVNGVASINFDDPARTCTRLVKELYGGGNMAPGGSVDLTIPCGVTGLNLVYGGSRNADIGTETLFNGGTKKNVTLTIEGGTLAQVFGGNNQGGIIWGDVTLNLVGGTIVDAYGGNNAGGNVKGSITVNVIDDESSTCPLALTNVFGGGKDAAYTPADATISSPEVNIKHVKNGNSISGSVFGGGQGATADVTSNPVVTIGDGESNHYVTIAGNVYGGGDAAAVIGSTTVEMKNAHSTASNLFGGGNQAGVSGTASVTLTAGHVTTGIYGGCNTSGTVSGAIDVNINGGKTGTDAIHLANVHGGGYGSDTETGNNVTVTIGNGTSTPEIWGDVYGGSGFGNVNDATAEPAQTTKVWLRSGTINGSLYGGGLGQLGDDTTDPVTPDYPAYVNGNVIVLVDGGAVKKTTNTTVTTGAVFGCNNVNGTPKGTVTVTINRTEASTGSGNNKVYALQGVYGGGNLAHYNPTTTGNYPTVTINGCNTSIKDVYGGGNAAAVPYTSVTVWGGDIDRVFAGGNGESGTPAHVGYMNTNANPSDNVYGAGTASAAIYGGSINQVFGGSNANGVIRVSSSINIDKDDSEGACEMHIGEVYGGGNFAAGNAGSITIGCTGDYEHNQEGIGDVYGGANAADVNNSIALTISGGHINRVFGGNNTSGAISGTITVNVDWNGSCTDNYLGYVFGGGNQAPYGDSEHNKGNYPVVNIKKADIAYNVFGGGLGATAIVYGNPQVTIGNAEVTNTKTVDITGDVYGGGDAAAVVGTPVVKVINNCDNEIGNVYGGGNAADVSGTNVTIDGGQIGMVFGGGHGDKNSNPQKAANVGGNVSLTVTGGTINKVFGGSNSKGNISGNITLSVDKGDNSCEMHITELYGGGNEAAGNAGTISIGCTGGDGEGIGDVYGGANAADVNNSIALNITGGHIGRVFGGNNTSGAISGTITVNVDWNGSCTNNYLGSVFGGGNLATYTGSPVVNILNGTVSGNVYGGGAGNLVDGNDRGQAGKVTGNPAVTIGDNVNGHTAIVTGDVYGGGDAADVAGTPVIVVNDCNTQIGYLYGGGNAADVNGTNITVNGGTINMAFGGGHGDKTASSPAKYADVKGNVVFNVYGGTISKVFAGSNSKGDITGTSALTINKTGTCDMIIGEVYGGGNEADGNAGTVTIGCTGDLVDGASGHVANPANIGTTLEGIGAVYGGARAANIGKSDSHSDITLNINSGMVGTVYGGNNVDGDIYGNIQVNINKTSDDCGWYVGNVYGGGNLADYTNNGNDYPEVNIQNGTVSGNVFGGGYGQSARVTANPQVKLQGGTVTGNVYGGGEAAPVTGNPTVTASGASVTANRLYGGGLGETAVVTGSTTVTVSAGTYDYVFGGGEAADMSGSVTVNIQGGTVNHDVYGGGALANTNIGNATNYGQNNESITSTSTNTTTVNVTGGLIGGDVYGGGLGQRRGYNGTLTTDNIEDVPAYVYGDVTVNLNNGVDENAKGAVINRIFGSNNVYGTPLGSVTVHVYATQNSSTNDIGSKNDAFDVAAVYGGGNLAAYVPNTAATPTNVIIDGCGLSSIEYVYGGGNAAPTPATHVEIMGSYLIANVFGGGNGKDNINYNGQSVANPGADVGIHKVSQAEYNASSYKYADADYGISASDYYVMYGDTTETIIGSTDVIIYGGHIGQVFGGSNTKGDIIKEAKVTLGDENVNTCPLEVDGVYGGSNEAYMSGSADIEMKCVNGMKEIYGGSRMADVHNDIVLTITGGHYQKVFGGNNLDGLIHGSITVNIEQTGCLPIVIDELYGGGNLAPYSVYGYNDNGTVKTEGDNPKDGPTINIVSCETIRKVFGGGLGGNAVVVGNPTININMVKGWTDGRYTGTEDTDPYNQYAGTAKNFDHIGDIGTVFGGGNEAKVIGETFVNIGTESSVKVHDVKKATYDVIKTNRTDITNPNYSEPDETVKDLTITVEGVNISGNVYGGGNQADVTGGSHIKIGPSGEEQQSESNPAPIRSAQPAQQTEEQPTQNAATESQQTRSITPTRL